MLQAIAVSQMIECCSTNFHCTTVTPYDGGAKAFHFIVYTNQSMHLIRNTNGHNLVFTKGKLSVEHPGGLDQFFPPVFRILFSESGAGSIYFHLFNWRMGGSNRNPRVCIQQSCFHRG